MTIGLATPAAGVTIVTTGTPPGAFIARGSGALSIPMTVYSAPQLPFAQLHVYLLTATPGIYCGQNLPDAPTWRPFARRRRESVKISGFQIFRLPCEVTGIRAIFHTRDNLNVGTPPAPSEIVAETTLATAYPIR